MKILVKVFNSNSLKFLYKNIFVYKKIKISVFASLVPLCSFSQNFLSDILNGYKDSVNKYGIIALIQTKSKIINAGIGEESPGKEISVNTEFCIGSTSKLFTTAIIFQLINEGKLSLGDSLGNFQSIPENRFIDKSITIKSLLNHTSGVKDYLTAPVFNTSLLNPYADYGISFINNLIDTISFTKTEKIEYSNTNFYFLKNIIEEIEDKSFAASLEERIFNPLGLKNTYAYYANTIPNLAPPIVNGNSLQEYPKMGINSLSIGVGNIVTTALDLNTFIRSLFLTEKIITTQNRDSIFTLHPNLLKPNRYFGVGAIKWKDDKKKMWGYTGRTISYVSYCFVDTENGNSYVLLANSADFSKKADALFKTIISQSNK